jgi:sugar phosphate permease
MLFFLIPHRAPDDDLPEIPSEGGRRLGVLAGLRVVLSNPQTWLVAVVATALYMPLSVLGALWGVQYISVLTGAGKVGASGAVSMLYVGWLIGGPFCGWLSDRIGHRRLLLVASGLLTVGLTALLLVFSSVGLVWIYLLMLAVGLASSPQVVTFVVAVEHNPRSFSGTAIAVTNMFVMLFGGIGMAIFGAILDWATGPGPLVAGADYPIGAYRTAMVMLPAISLAGAVCALVLRESIGRTLPDYAEPMG